MPRKQPEDPRQAEALALTQKGIEAGADRNHAEAAKHWEAASDYAEAYLPGADIYYWIKSGFGAALYEIGAYEQSIAVSKNALDWCSFHKAPLPALTLARSYRRLGNAAMAQTYIDHARSLMGDAALEEWTKSQGG
jgi:tetratricopeptide (TPR) repeat protein